MQEMRALEKWLGEEDTHKGMSMVAINIITHGTDDGLLRSAQYQGYGWHIPHVTGTLMDVKALRGKPKLFFANACRGCKY